MFRICMLTKLIHSIKLSITKSTFMWLLIMDIFYMGSHIIEFCKGFRAKVALVNKRGGLGFGFGFLRFAVIRYFGSFFLFFIIFGRGFWFLLRFFLGNGRKLFRLQLVDIIIGFLFFPQVSWGRHFYFILFFFIYLYCEI